MELASADSGRRLRLWHSLALATWVLNRGLIALAGLFVLLLVLPLVTDISRFPVLRWVADLEKTLAHLSGRLVPVRFNGHDLSIWVVIAALFALSQVCEAISQRSSDRIRYVRFKADYDRWKHEKHLEDDAVVLSPVNQVLGQLRAGKLKDREQLLKIFAETKRKLDEISQVLAFLSIDIVDSTGMKVDEEKAAVEHDFKAYRRFVESKLKAHGARQTVWTPDGLMTCFATVDAAVAAAQDVLAGLDGFNRDVRTMRRAFQVRCGVHTGPVYFEDRMKLEDLSDRIVDITAHFQKHAPSDTLCLTEPAFKALQHQGGFTPDGRAILGYEVYEWHAPQPVVV